MAVINKWENACRLCSEEKDEMLPIFGDEGLQRKVAQKLRACLPVLVYKTDPLPKQICQFCAARLDDAYEFREYCLSVYKSMHLKLLLYKDVESVQIFFEAMKNSPDPCQARLCKEKSRAPPPLVPLPTFLPLDNSNMSNADQERHSTCVDTLSELPCEVEIKEENLDSVLNTGTTLEKPIVGNCIENSPYGRLSDTKNLQLLTFLDGDNKSFNKELGAIKEEKRTSILEQVLTGNLTMNDRKELKPKIKLSSKWWCAPCNNYYRTRESLAKHIQLHCPRKYTCRECYLPFETVSDLATHEAVRHLKVTLNSRESIKNCHRCERQFVSWKMLKQHRLRDHLGKSIVTGTNSWCSTCNRFFPSIEMYQDHIELHQAKENYERLSITPAVSKFDLITMTKSKDLPKNEARRDKEHSTESIRTLVCPTCGKVCTQQSALSNHMRTHEPKRHKCEICGRTFGLLIRLAAHKLNEHTEEPTLKGKAVMACVEQEEALNAEREAREVKTRGGKRAYSEIELNSLKTEGQLSAKRSVSRNTKTFKNVARCGICLQWFDDHTTMLTHLQMHSDNYTCKSFSCHTCKKPFKEKWQLLRHEMSHKRNDATVTYTCAVCNQSFTEKSAYRVHQKVHIVDKTYHCSKCNKIFFKEVSLLTHQCIDGIEMVYGKGITSSEFLSKSPILGKSRKRRYKCSKCHASFGSFQSRNTHMKVHIDGTRTTIQKQKVEMKVNSDNNDDAGDCDGDDGDRDGDHDDEGDDDDDDDEDGEDEDVADDGNGDSDAVDYDDGEGGSKDGADENDNRNQNDNGDGDGDPDPDPGVEIALEFEKGENCDAMPKLSPETSLGSTVSTIERKVETGNEKTMIPPLKRTLIRTAGGYRCGVCRSPFVSRELAVAHLRSAHPVMPYQCPYCKKRFTTQYTFAHHIKTDHPDEPEK